MASAKAWVTEAKSILKQLGLIRYCTEKVPIQEALTIRKTDDKVLADLPWKILQGILYGNYKARDDFLEVFNCSESDEDFTSFRMEDFEKEDKQHGDKNDDNGRKGFSTSDVLSLIFSCCDPFLQQTLARKLFLCKLAIPILNYSLENGKPTLSVWALRTIEINGESAVEKPMPTISFLRVGMLTEGFSRSKIVNDILNPNNHQTFVNCNSPNGDVRRVLTDGIIECSWLFYSPNENASLKECATVLNLRGDATMHHEQCSFLCDLSSVVVVVITSKEMQDTHREMAKEIIRKSDQLVLVLLIAGDIRGKEKVRKEVQSCLTAIGPENTANVKLVVNRDKIGNLKNDTKLVKEIHSNLMETFPKTMTKSLAEAFNASSFPTEECNQPCKQGHKNAVQITNKLTEYALEDRKTFLLPIQEIKWKEYCKLEKELHRAHPNDGRTLEQYKEAIKVQMKHCRERNILSKKSIGKLFCQKLISLKSNKLQFFLKWVSLDLDRESRNTLPTLREEYGKKWDELQTSEGNTSNSKELSEGVNDLEMKMVNSALGLEHFFREIGQMFEVLHESRQNKTVHVQDHIFREVPSIVANLFRNGHPLEILDGDASGIPLIWLEAVFHELKQLTLNKKVLVVSVLGIQSSGKSTLLNTMFGLEFAVSAGRCTRGAFMQLVPVDKSTDLPFDYILVIDTEGIRALELATHKYTHDNELATFAVGIADVTVINIKGENSTEIKDVLEIVVCAFLRMKAAQITQFKRTCLFLHQNVPDADAEQKMMHSRHKLLESLDEITKQAAESENIPNIQGFRDVINCDIKEHIWYLSDLWNGNPPLAPVSPGYSDQVQRIRNCILNIAKEQETFLTIPDIFLRIKDLWKGILSEDFVFSFRNSLEASAYIELNSFVNSLLWELNREASSFQQRNVMKSIKACSNISELDDHEKRLMTEIGIELNKKHEILSKKLNEYFQSNPYHDIIIQWKMAKELALQNESDLLTGTMKQSLQGIKEHHRLCLKHKADSKKNLSLLTEQATEVAIALRNQGKLTEEDMKQSFDKFWTENYEKDVQEKRLNIKVEIQSKLSATFRSKHQVLFEKLENLPLLEHFSGSLKNILSVQIDKKVFNTSNFIYKLLDRLSITNAEEYVHRGVLELCDHMEASLAQHCKNTLEPIQTDIISTFLYELTENLEKFSKEMKNNHIVLTDDFIVTIAVRVSQYATKKYEEAQNEYHEKHSLEAYLKSFKQETWHVFRNTVRQSTDDVIAADMFCDKVGMFIDEEILRKISDYMTQSVMNDLSHNKFHLLQRILRSLAEEGDFKKYVVYIANPHSFALSWLQDCCNKMLFPSVGGISRFSQLASDYQNIVIKEVLRALSVASAEAPESNYLAAWIGLFCKNVDLPISEADLYLVSRRQCGVSYSNLSNIIKKKLEGRKIVDTDKTRVSQITWPDGSPFETMMRRIWGCKEVCPFCNEPCSNTDARHYENDKVCHTCIKHKSKGASGKHWHSSGKIVTDTCGFAIHANYSFGCSVVNYRCRTTIKCSTRGAKEVWHPCREYKVIVPDWDIPPDPSHSAVKYWQWFMATYARELAAYYQLKEPDIPNSWKYITKQQAIESLNEYNFT